MTAPHNHVDGGRGTAAIVAALLLAALAAGALACARTGDQPAVSQKLPATPEELLAELRTQKERIDQTTDQMLQRMDAFNASRQPGERTLQFSELFTAEFTDAQRDVLNQLVAQEKDVSYKSLLEKIIEDRNAIQGLQDKVMRLEQSLSDAFVVAKAGDTHLKLAMHFLVEEKKLDPGKARQLVQGVDLTDELLPGNKVWLFHDPEQDMFRTYVTEGEAGRTPLAVRRAAQRQLISERDAEKAAREVAEASVRSLEQVKAALEGDVAGLSERRASLEADVGRLERDLAFQQNSLFYHAASLRDLKDRGVISRVLKRVEDLKGVHFESALDLRRDTAITLSPSAFGLDQIRQVRLLPPVYQEGRDFAVETSEESGTARLVILDSGLFKGKEIIVAVGG